MKINFFYNLWGGALRDDTKNGCVADQRVGEYMYF